MARLNWQSGLGAVRESLRKAASSTGNTPSAIRRRSAPSAEDANVNEPEDVLAIPHKESVDETLEKHPPTSHKGPRTLVRERRRSKQLESEAAKEAEANKYADLPEWRRAMLLKKEGKLVSS